MKVVLRLVDANAPVVRLRGTIISIVERCISGIEENR